MTDKVTINIEVFRKLVSKLFHIDADDVAFVVSEDDEIIEIELYGIYPYNNYKRNAHRITVDKVEEV